jgi:hypothetical protein
MLISNPVLRSEYDQEIELCSEEGGLDGYVRGAKVVANSRILSRTRSMTSEWPVGSIGYS